MCTMSKAVYAWDAQHVCARDCDQVGVKPPGTLSFVPKHHLVSQSLSFSIYIPTL